MCEIIRFDGFQEARRDSGIPGNVTDRQPLADTFLP